MAKGSRVKRVFQSMKDGTKCNQLGLVKLVVIAFLYGFVCRWQILIMCWKNRITLANIILQSTAYFELNYSTPQWTILSASSGYMILKVCLQVLGITTAYYVKKSSKKPFVKLVDLPFKSA